MIMAMLGIVAPLLIVWVIGGYVMNEVNERRSKRNSSVASNKGLDFINTALNIAHEAQMRKGATNFSGKDIVRNITENNGRSVIDDLMRYR